MLSTDLRKNKECSNYLQQMNPNKHSDIFKLSLSPSVHFPLFSMHMDDGFMQNDIEDFLAEKLSGSQDFGDVLAQLNAESEGKPDYFVSSRSVLFDS